MIQIKISEQKSFNGLEFPLSLGPAHDLTIADTITHIQANRDTLLQSLLKHGAILFRGFPINNAKDFNDFSLAFGWQDLPYMGGAAVRKNVYRRGWVIPRQSLLPL